MVKHLIGMECSNGFQMAFDCDQKTSMVSVYYRTNSRDLWSRGSSTFMYAAPIFFWILDSVNTNGLPVTVRFFDLKFSDNE